MSSFFRPHRRVLVRDTDGVVRPRKRVVGAQDEPPPAQLRPRLAPKAADVRPGEADAKEAKLEQSNDGLAQLLPAGGVVAQPVGAPPP